MAASKRARGGGTQTGLGPCQGSLSQNGYRVRPEVSDQDEEELPHDTIGAEPVAMDEEAVADYWQSVIHCIVNDDSATREGLAEHILRNPDPRGRACVSRAHAHQLPELPHLCLSWGSFPHALLPFNDGSPWTGTNGLLPGVPACVVGATVAVTRLRPSDIPSRLLTGGRVRRIASVTVIGIGG